jgi:hypothetical protein
LTDLLAQALRNSAPGSRPPSGSKLLLPGGFYRPSFPRLQVNLIPQAETQSFLQNSGRHFPQLRIQKNH